MSGTAGRRGRTALAIVALAGAFVAGWWLAPGEAPRAPDDHGAPAVGAEAEAGTWTCSMHPQVRRDGPGKCPICFMDLVPVEASADAPALGDRSISLSDAARRLARVRTAVAARGFPEVEVRMVGKVDFDETRIRTIAPYVSGRVDRLYVDYTWLPVQRGDHLAELYSPQLIAAQSEYLEAREARDALASSDLEIMRETAARTVDAAREKLRLWGLTAEQIGDLEERGSPAEVVTLYSPMSGVVVEKNVQEGMYVETGTPLFRVADLSVVWVELQAFESDLAWIHLGQEVSFTVEAYPGERFPGRISFVEPIVNPDTRTVDLRVRTDNADGRLKPDMLVRATVAARVAGAGKVFDPYLAGKWISPMHPWVVKDRPGSCDVCGMKLVPTEVLGYASAGRASAAPVLVPDSAPLVTGKRAIVYVETDGVDGPVYEGREVVLGPRAGDVYVVESGLSEGERVVVEGAFRIDASLQIQGKRSMMSPEGGAPAPSTHDHGGHDHAGPPGPSRGSLYDAYLRLQTALAADDLGTAREAVAEVEAAAGGLVEVHGAAVAARNARDLEGVRYAFHDLSDAVVALARDEGAPAGDLRVMECPMTPRGKSRWIQEGGTVANPYFGAAMLRCGGEIARLGPPAGSR